MTLTEVYQKGREELKKAGIESPAFDAVRLFYKVFGLDRQGLILHGMEQADAEKICCFEEDIQRRSSRQPLQYLLGEWNFLDFTLKVGEGVLVPREETELLVKTAAEKLSKIRNSWENPQRSPVVIDLCAGTGAVGFGISSMVPDAEVLCVEWYEEAMSYLKQNIEKYGRGNIKAVKADVLKGPADLFIQIKGGVDMIVSNPPYIETAAINKLQLEVQKEPTTALDGGTDGLLFYRKIAQEWTNLLTVGGLLAVEIGETQGQGVKALFTTAGLSKIEIRKDFNDLERVVCGTKY